MTFKEFEKLDKLKKDYEYFKKLYEQFKDNSSKDVNINQLVIVLMGGNANPNITLVGYDDFQKELFDLIKNEIREKFIQLQEEFNSFTLIANNNNDKR